MKKILFLFGDDSHSISNYINELKNDLNKSNDLIVETIKLNNIEDIEDLLSTPINKSILSSNYLVMFNLDFKILKHLDKYSDQFLHLIKLLSTSKTVLLVLHIEKSEKSTKDQILESIFFNAIKSLAYIEEFFKLKPWQYEKLKDKVLKLASIYNLKFDNEALNILVEIMRNDLDLLNFELQKIQLFILPNANVTYDLIRSLYLDNYEIDDFYENIIKYKSISIISFENSFKSKLISPLYLIASLQNKLRRALLLKSYSESNISIYQISQHLNQSSYKIQNELVKLKDITSQDLNNILFNLSELEYKVKTGIVAEKNVSDLMLVTLS